MSSSVTQPKYRKQKREGKCPLAFIEIDGQRTYLGEFGIPESKAVKDVHRGMESQWRPLPGSRG